jgi:hypothetical protein
VARVHAAWPWLAEHRADLYQAILDADEAGDLERLRRAMEAASSAYEARQRAEAVRIFSRVLGAELWIAADDTAARDLEPELSDSRVVLTAEEGLTLGRMAEADARALFASLAMIQRVIPGSRLRGVGPLSDRSKDNRER